MNHFQPIQVNCYSGYIYAQKPKSFQWLDQELKVSKIKREWQEPGKRCFLVQTIDERVFQLCYNYILEEWLARELAM